MVSTTSLAAYRTILGDGRAFTQKQKVLIAIRQAPGLTRHELTEVTGFPINVVCGRVAELVHARHVYEGGQRESPLTRVKSYELYARRDGEGSQG
jgi:hypothetical protein